MPAYEKALLINLVGHAAGTVIFAIFLGLFLRDRVGSRLRGSRLTVSAAALDSSGMLARWRLCLRVRSSMVARNRPFSGL